jgi:hypothetical protein
VARHWGEVGRGARKRLVAHEGEASLLQCVHSGGGECANGAEARGAFQGLRISVRSRWGLALPLKGCLSMGGSGTASEARLLRSVFLFVEQF